MKYHVQCCSSQSFEHRTTRHGNDYSPEQLYKSDQSSIHSAIQNSNHVGSAKNHSAGVHATRTPNMQRPQKKSSLRQIKNIHVSSYLPPKSFPLTSSSLSSESPLHSRPASVQAPIPQLQLRREWQERRLHRNQTIAAVQRRYV